VAVWSDDRNGERESDIFGARFLADGSRAPGWPDTGLVLCAAPGIQRNPVVGPDGAGGVVVAWEDWRSGADIYDQVVNARGEIDPADMLPSPSPIRLAMASDNPVRRGMMSFTLVLDFDGSVTADVVDVAGRRLARIADGQFSAGHHTLLWNGLDANGARVPPGVRFLRVRGPAGDRALTFVMLQ
jgi:hypothetical protein